MTQNNNLVMLTIDPIEDDLVMLHHFTQIRGSVRMKELKIFSLNRFGPLVYVVRFKKAGITFGCTVKCDVHVLKNLE